jgi:hypothetical protein
MIGGPSAFSAAVVASSYGGTTGAIPRIMLRVQRHSPTPRAMVASCHLHHERPAGYFYITRQQSRFAEAEAATPRPVGAVAVPRTGSARAESGPHR